MTATGASAAVTVHRETSAMGRKRTLGCETLNSSSHLLHRWDNAVVLNEVDGLIHPAVRELETITHDDAVRRVVRHFKGHSVIRHSFQKTLCMVAGNDGGRPV